MAQALTIYNWRWYEDTSPTFNPLAAEQTGPVLADGGMGVPIHLRITYAAAEAFNGVFGLRVKKSGVAVADLPANGWAYGDGVGTDGAYVGTLLLTGSDGQGRYHENGTGAESGFGGYSTKYESDFCVYPVNGSVVPDAEYEFEMTFTQGGSDYVATGSTITITAPPASADTTVTVSGVAATSAVGTAAAQGAALVAPTGVSAAASVGTTTVEVANIAAPDGVGATASVGSAVVTGEATASPVGISATASVGAVLAGVLVTATPDGVSATASVGTAVAGGESLVVAAGLYLSAVVGSVIASGEALATCVLSGMTASVGTPRVLAASPSSGTAATIRRPVKGSAGFSNARRPRA